MLPDYEKISFIKVTHNSGGGQGKMELLDNFPHFFYFHGFPN